MWAQNMYYLGTPCTCLPEINRRGHFGLGVLSRLVPCDQFTLPESVLYFNLNCMRKGLFTMLGHVLTRTFSCNFGTNLKLSCNLETNLKQSFKNRPLILGHEDKTPSAFSTIFKLLLELKWRSKFFLVSHWCQISLFF